MKRKYTDSQIASMAKKLTAARKLISKLERQIDKELYRVSDRIIDLEGFDYQNKKVIQEQKALSKYEDKLMKLPA